MPKLLLKPRHRRQHNLSLLRDATADSTLNREPRMVSDDDIQYASTGEPSCNTTESSQQGLSICTTTTASAPRIRKVQSFRFPSEILSASNDSPQAMVGSSLASWVTPERGSDTLLVGGGDECRKRSYSDSSSPCSPWGQFVDMIPLSPSDDSFDALEDDSRQKRRFLPFCPSPQDTGESSTQHQSHPYLRSSLPPRRQRLLGRASAGKKLKGFVLHLPNDAAMVDEAQDAFQGLSF